VIELNQSADPIIIDDGSEIEVSDNEMPSIIDNALRHEESEDDRMSHDEDDSENDEDGSDNDDMDEDIDEYDYDDDDEDDDGEDTNLRDDMYQERSIRYMTSHLSSGSFNSGAVDNSRSFATELELLKSQLSESRDSETQSLILQQISLFLQMNTEETMSNYSGYNTLIPLLIDHIRPSQDNFYTGFEEVEFGMLTETSQIDKIISALRCLDALMEGVPSLSRLIVRNGALPIFIEKLNQIEYIEQAEEVLKCLEKVAQEFPDQVVEHGGLVSLLRYIDFFSTDAQRHASQAAAYSCRLLKTEHLPVVLEVMPILERVLEFPDKTVVENACVCITRIIDPFKEDPDNLEILLSESIRANLIKLLKPSYDQQNSFRSNSKIIKMFTDISRGSDSISVHLMESGILDIIYFYFVGSNSTAESSEHNSNSISRMVFNTMSSKDLNQTSEILDLAFSLLPTLPATGIFSLDPEKLDPNYYDTNSESIENSEEQSENHIDSNHINLIEKFNQKMINVLMETYPTCNDSNVRYKILTTLLKSIHFSNPQNPEHILHTINFGEFLSMIFNKHEHPYLAIRGLQITQILLFKIDGYNTKLAREGVFYEIEKMSKTYHLPKPDSNQDKENVATPSTNNESSSTNNNITQSLVDLRTLISRSRSEFEQSHNGIPNQSELFAIVNRMMSNPLSAAGYNNIPPQEKPDLAKNIIFRVEHLSSQFFDIQGSDISQLLSKLKDDFSSKSSQAKFDQSIDAFAQLLLGQHKDFDSPTNFELRISEIFNSLLESLKSQSSKSKISQKHLSFFTTCLKYPNFFSTLVSYLQSQLDLAEDFSHQTPKFVPYHHPFTMSNLDHQLRILVEPIDEEQGPSFMTKTLSRFTVKVLAEYIQSYERHRSGSSNSLNQSSNRHHVDLEITRDIQHSSKSSSSTSNSSSYANIVKREQSENCIQLYLNDIIIPQGISVYQVYCLAYNRIISDNPNTRLSSTTPTLRYKKVPREESDKANCSNTEFAKQFNTSKAISCKNIIDLIQIINNIAYESSSVYYPQLTQFERSNYADSLNTFQKVVQSNQFINSRLTSKVTRQLNEDFLAVTRFLPNWCTTIITEYPFLLPFNIRLDFVKYYAFGINSAIASVSRKKSNSPASNPLTILQRNLSHRHSEIRFHRCKRQITRDDILANAQSILHSSNYNDAILEIQFTGEVGTGRGPTAEFFSLSFQELQMIKYDLWRVDNNLDPNSEYVYNQKGLFPRPLQFNPNNPSHSKRYQQMKLLGGLVAKALADNRIIDLPLNQHFIRSVFNTFNNSQVSFPSLDQNLKLLSIIDPVTYQSLKHLIDLSNSQSASQIDDMGLSFEIPGYNDIELDSSQSDVTSTNVKRYLELVLDWTLNTGIQWALDAFTEGFDMYSDIEYMKIFTDDEITDLLGSDQEDWSLNTLIESIQTNHGYTMASPIITQFLETISNFDQTQKRLFLQFVTGSPRLPIGGFKALNPTFTIVRKDPESPNKSDDYLPSVMTCRNYFKLPQYSSPEILKTRLLQAIEEGQRSFDLS
jgi:E3 ubiquitin-protein ligase TRIP12